MKALKLILLLVVVSSINACKKDEVVPENPFDSVDYGESTAVVDTLDKNSIASIHNEIFRLKCANPGCHDGSFEPDFRTVMSTYSTLVYHPIVKNNAAKSFTYRVVPLKSAESVLYERITNITFVNQNDRMPQDNIGVGLPADDIARIKAWIDEGAKDFTGVSPLLPNNEPVYQWMYVIKDEGFPTVWDTEVLSEEADRIGGEGQNSIIFTADLSVVLNSEITDDLTPISQLKNARLLFSYDKNDFSSPIKTVTSQYLNYGTGETWYNKFSTTGFLPNKTVYMRYYINDGDQANDSEVPNNDSPNWFKTYWSFIIQ